MKPISGPVGDGPKSRHDPDAHGQAALLLVESLIHGLIENGSISVQDALLVTDRAAEVKEEIAGEAVESESTTQRSLRLFEAIGSSLASDRENDRAKSADHAE